MIGKQTISMETQRKYIWISLVASFFFTSVVATSIVHAQDSIVQISIDEATRERGYTLSLDRSNFILTLPPKALRIDAIVTVKEYLDRDKKLSTKIPEYYELASPIYQYDFGDTYPNDFRQEVIVHIRSQNPSTVLAFYDRSNEQWNILPTSHTSEGTAFARLGLAYAHVALIQKKAWRTDSHILPAFIPARAVYVVDETGYRYVGKAIHQQLSIASITKLMTALVFLEHNPGWDDLVAIRPSDDADSSRVNFRNGEKITVRDLFESMLVGSKNNSAKALARSTGKSTEEFVRRMNSKATELGLRRTHFVDTTGLSAKNVSSAAEIAQLARLAFEKKEIQEATMKAKYSFRAQNTRRWFTVRTTNALLGNGVQMNGAKTGFINESGYNFVLETTTGKKRLFVVILGAHDNEARFSLASELIRFVHETAVNKFNHILDS